MSALTSEDRSFLQAQQESLVRAAAHGEDVLKQRMMSVAHNFSSEAAALEALAIIRKDLVAAGWI